MSGITVGRENSTPIDLYYQIVPIGASALRSSKLIKNARLEVYKGAPHGLCSTHKDRVNADLLSFFGA